MKREPSPSPPVKAGLYLLTVGASVDFLTDENTVYPVYIDPTLTINSGTNYIEDTTIYSSKSAINYGTDTKLVVGTGSPSYGVGRAVVRIPGIYESVALEDMMPANILSATFTVRPYSSPAASQTLYLHPLEDYTWTESGATWNSITAGGYSNSAWSSATVGTSVATFNITSLAKEWPYGAYYPDSGFLIKLADSAEGSNCKRLYTTEYTTASYRPYATFTYLEDGVYRIKNMNSSLYMEVAGGKSKDHNGVIQSGMLSANPDRLSQLWKVKALSDGTFSIRPMHDPTMGLSIYNNTVQINEIGDRDNETIITETAQSGVAALWSITQASVSGGLSIRPDGNTKALRVSGDSLADGALIVQGNYDNYYFDSWLFEEVTDVTPMVLFYDTETGLRITETRSYEFTRTSEETFSELKIKPVYVSQESVRQEFSYVSSDNRVVMVDSSGTMYGMFEGDASVTVYGNDNQASNTIVVRIPFSGTYFIKNRQRKQYVQINDNERPDYSDSGAHMELWDYTGGDYQKWNITEVSLGYYKIVSEMSGLALSVPADDVNAEDKKLVQEEYVGAYRQQWKIEETENGSYKIQARSAEGTNLVMASQWHASDDIGGIGTDTNGVNVQQRQYLDNDSYKDEWYIDTKRIFHATVNNYFDDGFCVRFGKTRTESAQTIGENMVKASSILRKACGLIIEFDVAQYYNSPLDQCKETVNVQNVDNVCICGQEHSVASNIKSAFKSTFTGSNTVTNVYWTGHTVKTDTIDNRSFSNGTAVMMLETTQTGILGVLVHELNHQYDGKDHYCEKDDNDECKNKEICSSCGDAPRPESCVMKRGKYCDIYADTVICAECLQDILTHLKDHHE